MKQKQVKKMISFDMVSILTKVLMEEVTLRHQKREQFYHHNRSATRPACAYTPLTSSPETCTVIN